MAAVGGPLRERAERPSLTLRQFVLYLPKALVKIQKIWYTHHEMCL